MPITSDTVQFIARLYAVVLGAVVLLIVGSDVVAVFHFGDGEAINLLNQFNAPLVAGISALGLGSIGHQLLIAAMTKLLGVPVPAEPQASVPQAVLVSSENKETDI